MLLDVTLRRDGQTRRWTIHMSSVDWTCIVEAPGHVESSACSTRDLALAKAGEWQQEITAARAAGWA